VEEYLRRVKAALESVPYLNPGKTLDSGFTLGRVLGPTLKDTLDSLTDDPLLKAVLSMHCLLYGVSPRRSRFSSTPASWAAITSLPAGSREADGGWPGDSTRGLKTWASTSAAAARSPASQ